MAPGQKRSPQKFSSFGFTLIEIIMALAVLSVLASIVLMAISPAQRIAQAQNVSTITTAKQIDSALKQFYTIKSYYPNLGCGNNWCSLAIDEPLFKDQLIGAGILKGIPSYSTPDFSGCAITYFEKQANRYQLSFCLKNFDPRQNPYFGICTQEAPEVFSCHDANYKYLCWYYTNANLSRCFIAEDPPDFLMDFFPYP